MLVVFVFGFCEFGVVFLGVLGGVGFVFGFG